MQTERTDHAGYMRRCLDLAQLGAQNVAPNPLVGCVIVHHGRIIGEGFHRKYGGPHAEVEAVSAVRSDDLSLLPSATMYVSLEPCCHHGKTPPCTDLIIRSGIRHVVIAAHDPNPRVNGQGVARLQAAGVHVETGVLNGSASWQQRTFRHFVATGRPYVLIKFVQSADHFIGRNDEQVWLSNAYEKMMVHKMRSEHAAIMVGTNTAVIDNPRLTTREYFGAHPVRVSIDRHGRIPRSHHLFDDTVPTIIYTSSDPGEGRSQTRFVIVPEEAGLLPFCLDDLGRRGTTSLIVEGGAGLIKSFADAGLWNEAWVVTTGHRLGHGVRAPLLEGRLLQTYRIDRDHLAIMVP
ncbi:MAG: bifunctional diaminohydroxyphosphoribosylaminopyrimidine deaminase/5-amino-6-(5-phosphoribosylamino)uracil reductase RibD [Saprospiraceae bacterium]|nr:bifunctional diaminohydroxyphosphoribosylaminopyrimidine deaminase/5-amino-6-(5-phosphoribosylamino)uracil reductase RibD [Saprospiraceae bacterium]